MTAKTGTMCKNYSGGIGIFNLNIGYNLERFTSYIYSHRFRYSTCMRIIGITISLLLLLLDVQYLA